MTKHDVTYHLLPDDPESRQEYGRSQGSALNKISTSWTRYILILVILASFSLNLVFIRILLRQGRSVNAGPQVLYSPAQDVIEYKPVKFHSGFGSNLPIYDRPPAPEVDEAWEELYEYPVVKVPKHQAIRMPNKTYPILGDEENYMAAIAVFHDLHCLNIIRKALHPEYYTLDADAQGHMGHCVSNLRQSLMCAGDISLIVWQWSERSHEAKERADVVHSCRDFDRIREWAREHKLPYGVNKSVYIEDDIDIPTF